MYNHENLQHAPSETENALISNPR